MILMVIVLLLVVWVLLVGIDVNGDAELEDVNVGGASTFTGAIDANSDLDVDGHTELDTTNI